MPREAESCALLESKLEWANSFLFFLNDVFARNRWHKSEPAKRISNIAKMFHS